MLEIYEQELQEIRARMEKAEEFSKKFPCFASKILSEKLTGEDRCDFGDWFKSLHCAWGLHRYFYNGKLRARGASVTNYGKEHDGVFLTSIYMNTLSLYNSHENFGLLEVAKDLDLFFLDSCNSTFYATDKQLEPLLEALNTWYLKAKEEVKTYNKAEEINVLKEKLAALEEPKPPAGRIVTEH